MPDGRGGSQSPSACTKLDHTRPGSSPRRSLVGAWLPRRRRAPLLEVPRQSHSSVGGGERAVSARSSTQPGSPNISTIPPLRVVDCRWYLVDPEKGRNAYEEGHIKGAAYMSVDTELSATRGPGRHPLPTPEETAHRLGTLGIGDRNFVVAYDDEGGAIAARLWWMLRSIGHQRAAVLDGGIQAWVAAGGAVDTNVPDWPPAPLSILGASQTIDREALAARLGDVALIDARAPSDIAETSNRSTPGPVTSRRPSMSRSAPTSTPTAAFCPPNHCVPGSAQPASKRPSTPLRTAEAV